VNDNLAKDNKPSLSLELLQKKIVISPKIIPEF